MLARLATDAEGSVRGFGVDEQESRVNSLYFFVLAIKEEGTMESRDVFEGYLSQIWLGELLRSTPLGPLVQKGLCPIERLVFTHGLDDLPTISADYFRGQVVCEALKVVAEATRVSLWVCDNEFINLRKEDATIAAAEEESLMVFDGVVKIKVRAEVHLTNEALDSCPP